MADRVVNVVDSTVMIGDAVGVRPMAIAIVTSIHPDFDARVWRHAKLLAESGHAVHLVCPWSVEPGSMREGVIFHPFQKASSRGARLLQVPSRLLPKLWKMLRQVDVVHFHDIDLLPWMTLLSLRKPVVYDVHENYAEEMLVREWIPAILRRPLAFAVRWGQWLCAQIIRNIVLVAPSQEPDFKSPRLRRTYIFNYASRALVKTVESNFQGREPVVVFIGAHNENNGSMLFLDIAERVHAIDPDVKFLTAERFFESRFRDKFLAELSRRNLTDVVRLVPSVRPHEIMCLLNQAIVAISPNLRVPQQIKGIHTKIFEYMAAGLPIVLSDLPHQIEVVERNQAGLMARPEDVDTFVDAVLKLTGNPVLAGEMGRAGQQAYIEHYSYESQLPGILKYYAALLSSKRRDGC